MKPALIMNSTAAAAAMPCRVKTKKSTGLALTLQASCDWPAQQCNRNSKNTGAEHLQAMEAAGLHLHLEQQVKLTSPPGGIQAVIPAGPWPKVCWCAAMHGTQ